MTQTLQKSRLEPFEKWVEPPKRDSQVQFRLAILGFGLLSWRVITTTVEGSMSLGFRALWFEG